MKLLVFDCAQPLASPAEFRIVVVDHQRLHLGERERLLHHLGELAVDDQHLGLAVIELEGDDGGVEPRVDGVEHGAGHRARRSGIRAWPACWRARPRRCRRARCRAGRVPRRAVARARRTRRSCGAAAPWMTAVLGEHRRRALQERQRGERLEVRRIAVEIDVVGRHVHHQPAAASLRMVSVAINPAAATIARPASRSGDRPRSKTASAGRRRCPARSARAR